MTSHFFRGGGTPTSPSPAPSAPAPSAPPPSPGPGSGSSPGATLSGFSINESSVLSQAQPVGTVSLTSVAPIGGVAIALVSSDPSVVQVPATVTIGAGTASANFTISTSTVSLSSQATITASYAGAARSVSLTVRPPVLSAAFTVTSPQKGTGACVMGPGTTEADCALDGGRSTGFVQVWIWRYWTAENILGHSSTGPRSGLNISTQCAFFNNARGGDDTNGGRYIQMEVELIVQGSDGARSSPVRQSVRMYPNRLCNFTY